NDQTPADWKRQAETAESVDPIVGPEPIAAEPAPAPVDPAIARRSRTRRIGFAVLALIVLVGLALYALSVFTAPATEATDDAYVAGNV
ncbi:hypothetical protein, partial [Clostridium perfringens]